MPGAHSESHVRNDDLTIGFIGGGNMARAMAGGLLRAGHPAARLVIGEPDESQRQRIAALGPLRVTASNTEVAADADVLVLAVKPQVMPAALAQIAGARRPPRQLVLSVAAGLRLATLARALGESTPAIRAMPNQPALIGVGMTALVGSPSLGPAERNRAEYVAGATGRVLWLDDESLMDAVTAVSGSGPAYFYLLIELMEAAARDLGLTPDVARMLVRQTALGAARMASEPGADARELRAGVTSPGGTTAAALSVLEAAGLGDILRRAMTAARDRGIELGGDRH